VQLRAAARLVCAGQDLPAEWQLLTRQRIQLLVVLVWADHRAMCLVDLGAALAAAAVLELQRPLLLLAPAARTLLAQKRLQV